MKAEIQQLISNLKDELQNLQRDLKEADCEEERMYFEGSIDSFEHIITLLEISVDRN